MIKTCMSPTITTKKSCNYRALLFLATYSTATALLLLSPKSEAYEWLLRPSGRVDLIFSDNINLATGKGADKKESSFITRLTPGIYSKFTSRRFDSETSFRMRNIIYSHDSDRNRIRLGLRSHNTGTIIKDFFYVDANARIRQVNQSILGKQGDDVNTTGNFRTVQLYSISPYIVQRFGNFASSEIRYARILSDSDASGSFLNSDTNAYQANLVSGPDFRTVEWGLNYSREDIDFDRRPKTVKLETEIANIQYNFTRRFGLTGTGGYEENTFGAGFDKPKGIRWSAGFIWLPTPRTSIEASGGQRFFGDTYYYRISHRTRLLAMRSSYREEIRSTRNTFELDGTGDTFGLLTDLLTSQSPPGTSPAEIAELAQQLVSELGLPPNLFFGDQFLTNRFFLEKRFRASVGALTRKHTFIFRVFHRNRKPITPSTALLDTVFGGGQQANMKSKGVNATWSWRVKPRTRVNLVLRYVRRHFPTIFPGRTDKLYRLSFSITRRFSENVVGLLRYRYRQRTSNAPLSGYTENRFMASVRMTF